MKLYKLTMFAATLLLGAASAKAATTYTYDFTAKVDSTVYCCSSAYTPGEIVHGSFSYVATPMTADDPYDPGFLFSPAYALTSFIPHTGVGAIKIPSVSDRGDVWSENTVQSNDESGGWNWYGSPGWKTALVFKSSYNTVSEPASGWAWSAVSLDSTADIAAADRVNWINGALPPLGAFTAGSRVAYGAWSAATGADGYEATITGLTLASAVPAVPEPSSWTLAITGLAVLGLAIRRRQIVGRSILGASALAGLLVAQQAGAVTLPTVANGLGVYDSGLNVTWTLDANLLRTMELNPKAYGYNNLDGLLTGIVNASGGAIHDTPNYFDGAYNVNAPFDAHPGANSGSHPLSAADFGTGYGYDRPFGSADWFGAKAFVNFLNSIDYAGSNRWSLPTADATCISGSCVNNSSLTALGDNSPGHPYNDLQFTNTRGVDYPLWYDLEAWNGTAALNYRRYYGGGNSLSYKYNYEGVWAVSPGQLGSAVGAVPEPETDALMVAGMCVLGVYARRAAKRAR